MTPEIRLNLSRPHARTDHRRVCAVIGCRKHETPYTAPFCWIHDKAPEVHEALKLALAPKEAATLTTIGLNGV